MLDVFRSLEPETGSRILHPDRAGQSEDVVKAVEKVREARGCLYFVCALFEAAHPLHLHAVVHDFCLMPMPGQGGLRTRSLSARAVWCPSNKRVVIVILGISWQEKACSNSGTN